MARNVAGLPVLSPKQLEGLTGWFGFVMEVGLTPDGTPWARTDSGNAYIWSELEQQWKLLFTLAGCPVELQSLFGDYAGDGVWAMCWLSASECLAVYLNRLVHSTNANAPALAKDGVATWTLRGDPASMQQEASCTASITSGVMNVTAMISGTLALGQVLSSPAGGISAEIFITSFGTGTGGTGTYNVTSVQPNVSSRTINTTSRFNSNGDSKHVPNKMLAQSATGDVILMGSPTGLIRSTNRGVNWTRFTSVPKPSNVSSNSVSRGMTLAIDTASGTNGSGRYNRVTCWSQGNGLWQTEDGEDTFAVLASQPATNYWQIDYEPGASPYRLHYTKHATGHGRRTSAGGFVDSPGTAVKHFCFAPSASPSIPGMMAGHNGGAICRSNDYGATWPVMGHTAGLTRMFPAKSPVAGNPAMAWTHNKKYEALLGPNVDNIIHWPAKSFELGAGGYGPMGWEQSNVISLVANTGPPTAPYARVIELTAGGGQLVAMFSMFVPGSNLPFELQQDKTITRFGGVDKPRRTGGPVADGALGVGYDADYAINDYNHVVVCASGSSFGGASGVHSGYSPDGGLTWVRWTNQPSPGGRFGGCIAVGNKNNVVFVSGQNGWPQYSLNADTPDATWASCNFVGVTNIANGTFNGFGSGDAAQKRHILISDKANPGTFYIYNFGTSANGDAYHGVWKSTDGGANFTKINTVLAIDRDWDTYSNMLRQPLGTNHLFLIAGVTSGALDGSTQCKIRRSRDGGVADWASIMTDIYEPNLICFGKGPRGSSYPAMYIHGHTAADGLGIYESLDAGSNSPTFRLVMKNPLLGLINSMSASLETYGLLHLGWNSNGHKPWQIGKTRYG